MRNSNSLSKPPQPPSEVGTLSSSVLLFPSVEGKAYIQRGEGAFPRDAASKWQSWDWNLNSLAPESESHQWLSYFLALRENKMSHWCDSLGTVLRHAWPCVESSLEMGCGRPPRCRKSWARAPPAGHERWLSPCPGSPGLETVSGHGSHAWTGNPCHWQVFQERSAGRPQETSEPPATARSPCCLRDACRFSLLMIILLCPLEKVAIRCPGVRSEQCSQEKL